LHIYYLHDWSHWVACSDFKRINIVGIAPTVTKRVGKVTNVYTQIY